MVFLACIDVICAMTIYISKTTILENVNKGTSINIPKDCANQSEVPSRRMEVDFALFRLYLDCSGGKLRLLDL